MSPGLACLVRILVKCTDTAMHGLKLVCLSTGSIVIWSVPALARGICDPVDIATVFVGTIGVCIGAIPLTYLGVDIRVNGISGRDNARRSRVDSRNECKKSSG